MTDLNKQIWLLLEMKKICREADLREKGALRPRAEREVSPQMSLLDSLRKRMLNRNFGVFV